MRRVWIPYLDTLGFHQPIALATINICQASKWAYCSCQLPLSTSVKHPSRPLFLGRLSVGLFGRVCDCMDCMTKACTNPLVGMHNHYLSLVVFRGCEKVVVVPVRIPHFVVRCTFLELITDRGTPRFGHMHKHLQEPTHEQRQAPHRHGQTTRQTPWLANHFGHAHAHAHAHGCMHAVHMHGAQLVSPCSACGAWTTT